MPKGIDISKLSPQELAAAMVIADPVLWAESTLRDLDDFNKPFKVRWYQAKMMRSQSRRRVVRAGRRIGKTVAMCVHMLWYANTHAHRKQLVVCPYQAQVNAIFETLRQLIFTSPSLQDSIETMTKSPYNQIKLKNGHVISGFTTGSKTGSAGAAIRGQGGDWIYLDEMDYMTGQDFESVLAIATANNKVGIWMSSTPTGARSMFYKACMIDKSIWEQHYYPSMVNPDWNKDMEDEMRRMYSEQGYIHEILAEFGEETIGVFSKEHIDRAQMPYSYIGTPNYDAIRFIGVDWDKYGAATQILVVEFDNMIMNSRKELGMFRIINRIEISKGKFTFDNAVRTIEELNEIYQPAGIYIDRGFGEYQIETLHLHGLENPDTMLHKRVVGVHFGSFKEVMDPATKQIERKPMKAFLVSQLQLLFERDRIAISSDDEMVINQLENYRMVKKRAGGAPVFSDENEHTIDCLMLAVLGFLENFPHLTKFAKTRGTRRVETMAVGSKFDTKALPGDTLREEWDEPSPRPAHKVEIGYKGKSDRIQPWAQRGAMSGAPMKRRFW